MTTSYFCKDCNKIIEMSPDELALSRRHGNHPHHNKKFRKMSRMKTWEMIGMEMAVDKLLEMCKIKEYKPL